MDTTKKIGLAIYLILGIIFFTAGSGSYFWYKGSVDEGYLLRRAIADTVSLLGVVVVSIVLRKIED